MAKKADTLNIKNNLILQLKILENEMSQNQKTINAPYCTLINLAVFPILITLLMTHEQSPFYYIYQQYHQARVAEERQLAERILFTEFNLTKHLIAFNEWRKNLHNMLDIIIPKLKKEFGITGITNQMTFEIFDINPRNIFSPERLNEARTICENMHHYLTNEPSASTLHLSITTLCKKTAALVDEKLIFAATLPSILATEWIQLNFISSNLMMNTIGAMIFSYCIISPIINALFKSKPISHTRLDFLTNSELQQLLAHSQMDHAYLKQKAYYYKIIGMATIAVLTYLSLQAEHIKGSLFASIFIATALSELFADVFKIMSNRYQKEKQERNTHRNLLAYKSIFDELHYEYEVSPLSNAQYFEFNFKRKRLAELIYFILKRNNISAIHTVKHLIYLDADKSPSKNQIANLIVEIREAIKRADAIYKLENIVHSTLTAQSHEKFTKATNDLIALTTNENYLINHPVFNEKASKSRAESTAVATNTQPAISTKIKWSSDEYDSLKPNKIKPASSQFCSNRFFVKFDLKQTDFINDECYKKFKKIIEENPTFVTKKGKQGIVFSSKYNLNKFYPVKAKALGEFGDVRVLAESEKSETGQILYTFNRVILKAH